MKTRRLAPALLALVFALTLQWPVAAFAQGYSAKLISPKPGEVLTPGQVVRIQWKAEFPHMDLSMCETEILLSLDGGKTIYMFITSSRRPEIQYFDWTVPNAPTQTGVLDIRFGCLNIYPETSSLQIRSSFVIGPAVN